MWLWSVQTALAILAQLSAYGQQDRDRPRGRDRERGRARCALSCTCGAFRAKPHVTGKRKVGYAFFFPWHAQKPGNENR